jgi:sugar phosphate isomerase/epimerase
MKIFAQTFTLNPQTPIETISLAHQQGFQGVEIACEYPRGPLDYTSEAISTMKGLAQEYDMPLQVHAPYVNLRPADLNPRIRDASVQSIKDGIDFASQIGCRIVTAHLGSISKGRLKHAHKSVRAILVDSVRALTDYAEDHDVTIAVENVQSDMDEWEEAVGKTAEEIVCILKEIDVKNVGVTFDVGHANTVGNPEDFAVKLAPYMVNVHLHDNHGTRDQHLVIGEGKIDFLKILRTLKEVGYAGPLVLEYFDSASLLRAKTELVKLLKSL